MEATILYLYHSKKKCSAAFAKCVRHMQGEHKAVEVLPPPPDASPQGDEAGDDDNNVQPEGTDIELGVTKVTSSPPITIIIIVYRLVSPCYGMC